LAITTKAKGEATKQRIVAATSELIHSHGYNATGLNQIIKHSGAPKGSLYFHFPEGKEQIVEAALLASGATVTSLMQQSFTQSKNQQQAIKQCIDFFKEVLISTNFQKGCPVATVALEATGETPRIQNVCANIYQDWLTQLEQGLGEANAEHANVVLMLIEGALVLSKAKKSIDPLNQCEKHLSALFSKNN